MREFFNQGNSEEVQQFLRLYLKHQKSIFGYIVSMLPNWAEADDILQETTEIMWRKFADFEPGTNFSAWATKIARLQVLRHYRNHSTSHIRFDSDLLELLSEDSPCAFDDIDHRVLALQECMTKLTDNQKNLIKMRYYQTIPVKEMAVRARKPAHTIYKLLSRIHQSLMLCIRRRMRVEGTL